MRRNISELNHAPAGACSFDCAPQIRKFYRCHARISTEKSLPELHVDFAAKRMLSTTHDPTCNRVLELSGIFAIRNNVCKGS